MPISPNRPPFKAAIAQADLPPTIIRPLSLVRSSTVKSMYWSHRAVQVLSVLWLLLGLFCVGAGIMTLAGQVPQIAVADAALFGVGLLFLGLLAIVTAVGCWLRAHWGRFCGIILSILLLIKFPYGTTLGALGAIVLCRASPLFGQKRFAGGELVEEYKDRKKRYGA